MSASFRGKTIAFSGPFASSAHKDAVARAVKLGATVSPNVSKKVDFLVKGDASPKGQTHMKEVVAKYNGTKIVSANSFLKFVQQGGADRMKKVAAAIKSAAAASAPKKTAGRVRSVAPSRTLKASAHRVEEKAEPMPWEKGSKFHRRTLGIKKAKITRALNAKRAAKEQKTAAAIVAAEVKKAEEAKKEAATVAVEAAPKAEAAAPKTETATITADAGSNTITFTPSKGLTVQFNGDFSDFCRVASQLESMTDSITAAPAASTVTPVEAPKVEAKAEEPVVAKKEASAEEVAPVSAEVIEKMTTSAEKKPVVAATAVKKTIGRTRTVAPFRKLPEGAVALKKKTISFTGTFFQLKRIGLQAMAHKAGAKVTTGIYNDTDYVVVGADAAHKKKLAKKLGVATISEKNFIASCGQK